MGKRKPKLEVERNTKDLSAVYQLPSVPTDTPCAPQPEGLSLSLFPHQLRSLYLMQLMEANPDLTEIILGKSFRCAAYLLPHSLSHPSSILSSPAPTRVISYMYPFIPHFPNI
jgi:hypothetical protein